MDSPNITRLHQVFEDDKSLYLVMDLVGGGELLQYVVKAHRVAEKEAATLIKELTTTLEFVHNRNIIHRDIKLENILLCSKESLSAIKLADFGLAIRKGTPDILKKCGTPGYIAPEMIRNGACDERSDYFAVGVILFILLSGKPPFVGKNFNEVLAKNAQVQYSFNQKIWQGVSFTAIDLTRRLLHHDPDKRITPLEILNHPWITYYTSTSTSTEGTATNSAALIKYDGSFKIVTMKEEEELSKLDDGDQRTKKSLGARLDSKASDAASEKPRPLKAMPSPIAPSFDTPASRKDDRPLSVVKQPGLMPKTHSRDGDSLIMKKDKQSESLINETPQGVTMRILSSPSQADDQPKSQHNLFAGLVKHQKKESADMVPVPKPSPTSLTPLVSAIAPGAPGAANARRRGSNFLEVPQFAGAKAAPAQPTKGDTPQAPINWLEQLKNLSYHHKKTKDEEAIINDVSKLFKLALLRASKTKQAPTKSSRLELSFEVNSLLQFNSFFKPTSQNGLGSAISVEPTNAAPGEIKRPGSEHQMVGSAPKMQGTQRTETKQPAVIQESQREESYVTSQIIESYEQEEPISQKMFELSKQIRPTKLITFLYVKWTTVTH